MGLQAAPASCCNPEWLIWSTFIKNDLNISIKRGDVTAIMGPSGTGKTTLLRFITGQLVPDRGSVWVNGYQVNRIRIDTV